MIVIAGVVCDLKAILLVPGNWRVGGEILSWSCGRPRGPSAFLLAQVAHVA